MEHESETGTIWWFVRIRVSKLSSRFMQVAWGHVWVHRGVWGLGIGV